MQRDRIQQLRQQLSDASKDIQITNQALDLLRKVQTIQYNGRSFSKEPRLSNFYKPSEKMKEYQYLTIGAMGIGIAYVVHKYV